MDGQFDLKTKDLAAGAACPDPFRPRRIGDDQRRDYAEAAIREAVESYSPLLRWENVNVLDPVWRDTGAGRAGDIAIDYDTGGRFSFLPFVPAPPETIRVSTTFVVADPGG